MKFSKNDCIRVFFLLGCSFALLYHCTKENKPLNGRAVIHKTIDIKPVYEQDYNRLFTLVTKMNQTNHLDTLKKLHIDARLALKSIEPYIAYRRSALYKALNQPNLPTIHEDSNGVQNVKAQGFQVVEELLYEDEPQIKVIKSEINAIYNTLQLEKNNFKVGQLKDYQFLWMVRNELWRILSQGIVGFDSPVLTRSMPESAQALKSLKKYLQQAESLFTDKAVYQKWMSEIELATQYLEENNNFDTFNRYHFVKEYLQPMLLTWKLTSEDWKVEFPLSFPINDKSIYFFGKETFNMQSFTPSYAPKMNDSIVLLGKQLFNDESLSNNERMSCGTCHVKALYFADGKVKGEGGNTETLRNVPTMLYAGLQREQFYDGRVALLENQITDVVTNDNEFHTDMKNIEKAVQRNAHYKTMFTQYYQDGLNEKNIRNAIATYIRSLNPFNSKFDKNMRGEENSITATEKLGFNVFMGKGACATCHFAPVFNGTIPPEFNHTEYEVLGVPKSPIWENAEVDEDVGRYSLHHAEKRKFAFKTPTIRNAEKTAPYMHNGVYTTLEDVIEFYDVGGGVGIGISLDNQTLPFDELSLTEEEKKGLIAFLKSLTDEL